MLYCFQLDWLTGFYTIGASTASGLFNYIVQVVSSCYIVKTGFAIFQHISGKFRVSYRNQ